MYHFIKTVEFPNTRYQKFLPYAADSHARVEKVSYKHRLSEKWFSDLQPLEVQRKFSKCPT
jgi:hypothetical protein